MNLELCESRDQVLISIYDIPGLSNPAGTTGIKRLSLNFKALRWISRLRLMMLQKYRLQITFLLFKLIDKAEIKEMENYFSWRKSV